MRRQRGWKNGPRGSFGKWDGEERVGALVRSRRSRGISTRAASLPSRTQRGGRDLKETDAYAEVISDFSTLFVDRVPDALAAEAMRAVLANFGVPDSPLTRALTDAAAKLILRKLRGKLADKVEQLNRDRGPIITRLSGQLCRLLPGCDEATVSEEVAKRKGTTIQGAHAWMVRPLLFISPGTATFANEVLRIEARSACLEHGTADSLRAFFQTEILTTGKPLYDDALTAINKGCKE